MIPQLYPGHQGDHHERALDRTLDGRHAELLAQRRRYVDASPLACWINEREPRACRRGRPARPSV
jgi:hypothetical protein